MAGKNGRMKPQKPYAPACDRNRQPILEVLQDVFRDTRSVLEIGSGTGQHAVYFCRAMPWLVWQSSDLVPNHPGIIAWIKQSGLGNVLPPLDLDVNQELWPIDFIEGVFSANTVHIMSWQAVCRLFAGLGRILATGGFFSLYGPFNYNGNYTSKSNADFDCWLKERDPLSAIRDFEAICDLATNCGLKLVRDYEMPSNNRLIVWSRSKPADTEQLKG